MRDTPNWEALTDLLYKQSYPILLANFVIPLPVAYVFRHQVPASVVLVWIGALYLLSVARLVLAHGFRRARRAGRGNGLRWAWSATLFSWASAALWGAFGWVGFIEADPVMASFTCIVLTGLACGAVPSLSSFPPAYAGTAFAMLSPLAVRCLIGEGEIFDIYLLFVVCLGAANIYYSLQTFAMVSETVRLRFENLALIDDLEQQRDRARAADRSKSQFLAAASHDLRQPIHAMSLFVEALAAMARNDTVPTRQVTTIAERLRSVISNFGDVLNGLLDVSRLDAGVMQTRREAFALAPMLDALRDEFEDTARERKLEWRVVATRAWVETDPALLRRILANLLANAFHYTSHGKVLIGIRRRGSDVEIQVLDTGAGIPADQSEAIFEEFVQLPNAQKQGMGLGLSIVKRTARLLGHPLALQSRVGRGSVFSILVPIAASGFAAAAPRSSADHRALSIAIVDDDPVALDALHDLLVLWGHKVWTGVSAEAVVSAMGDETPDLLVTDYHLGAGRTGAEAAATIRAHVGAWLPVIILTGDAPAAVLQDAGINDPILSKPVDAHGLRQAIASSIG